MENNKQYNIGTRLQLKKKHPCGGDTVEVIRVGADIKIKCLTCNHVILISRIDLNKRIKKIISGEVNEYE